MSQKKLYSYLPDQVSVIVNGRALSGFAIGSFVTVARDEENFKVTNGLNSVSRSRNENHMGKITVTLKQTAPDCAYLDELARVDEVDASGVFSVLIRDASGLSKYDAAECWIEKYADADFSNEITNRVFTIIAADLNMLSGGN